MLRLLLVLFRPLPEIAKEIRLLRELYELDLASRTPPILRITEKPGRNDTEVSYAGIPEEKSKSWKRGWFAAEPDEDVEEDEE